VPFLGTVNLWLLKGEPLTLVDTGPRNDEALEALEEQLAEHGIAVEDLELVLLTHHHLDHSGLAATLKRRSGAQIAALRPTAAWGIGYHDRLTVERDFTMSLLAAHGVRPQLVAESESFWDHIVRDSEDFDTDQILADGDLIQAGGRTLRALHRPGHSASDTVFVDDAASIAFVGDHLLAEITSGAELMPSELPGDGHRRALVEYLANLRRTATMPLLLCLSGHGPEIRDHKRLIEERLQFHASRLDNVARGIQAEGSTAFQLAGTLWPPDVVESQPVLVVWEVLGHLDVLLGAGVVTVEVDDAGRHLFFRHGQQVGP
jgi:glyoxylase-like metal-dependent hydrolase (beta-lactamase superfamily II)